MKCRGFFLRYRLRNRPGSRGERIGRTFSKGSGDVRRIAIAQLLALFCSGCTGLQLKRSTIDQASTLSELQYQQVMNNLAMFAGNPAAIPWHITIKDGSAQV